MEIVKRVVLILIDGQIILVFNQSLLPITTYDNENLTSAAVKLTPSVKFYDNENRYYLNILKSLLTC